jgi:hypothetical protein
MLGEREAVALQVRPYSVHGSAHVELVLAFEGEQAETVRLGAESAPADLAAGERVLVRSVMQTVVEVLRPEPGPQAAPGP